MPANFELEHFVHAQNAVIDFVQQELTGGRKRTHWMWFVFPQLAGLGRSSMAMRYAIDSLQEAQAYLGHPVLGPRLISCTKLVNRIEHRSAHDIFGSPDDMKFHSSMTLFAAATKNEFCFVEALVRYFNGQPDPATQRLLATEQLIANSSGARSFPN